jgi:hypothetical protein
MPAPLFKRFTPPTPATVKQPSSPSSSPAPVNADAELSTEAATLKREKKSKKSSKATEAGADPVGSQEDVVMEDAPTLETSKKPKKRKSEVVAEREGQEDDVSKKHKAVFSKFEKASKLAEARNTKRLQTKLKSLKENSMVSFQNFFRFFSPIYIALLTICRSSATTATSACARTRIRTDLFYPPFMAGSAHHRRGIQDHTVQRAGHTTILRETAGEAWFQERTCCTNCTASNAAQRL